MTSLLLFLARYRPVLRLFISSTLIAWLLSRVDLGTVVDRWSAVNWLLLLISVPFLYLLNTYLRTVRLRLILLAQGFRLPFRWLWLVQLKSSFVVTFLPGGVAGDIYRTFAIGREAQRTLDSITSVLLEKVVGLAAMMFLSIVSLYVSVYLLGIAAYSGMMRFISALAAVLFIASLIFYVLVRGRLIQRWQPQLPFWNRLPETAEKLSILLKDSQTLISLAVLSLFLQFSIVLWYFFVARAMALDISLVALMVSVPIVELVLSVPISVGGIGVRDTALVILMVPFGLSAEAAVSLSLLVALTATVVRILSGLAFVVKTTNKEILEEYTLEQLT